VDFTGLFFFFFFFVYEKCGGQFLSPALLSRGMNTMLCVLALLEIIRGLLLSARPSFRLFLLLQELIPFEQSLSEVDGLLACLKIALNLMDPPKSG